MVGVYLAEGLKRTFIVCSPTITHVSLLRFVLQGQMTHLLEEVEETFARRKRKKKIKPGLGFLRV